MSAGQAEAIKKTAPGGVGTTEPGAAMIQAITATSATAIAVNTVTALPPFLAGQWYTFVTTSDAHIRFGVSTVAAATQNDYLIKAGVEYDWWIDTASAFFSVVRDTAATDGNLWRYQSNR